MRILELRNIFKTYDQGKLEVPVLKNVSLSVEEGEYVAIMGPSGSGKTTLMNLIGCLDSPTSGEYLLEGEDLSKHSDLKLSEVRLRSIGFVFQSFYLLSRQSAIENVALPLLYAGVKKQERLETAKKALERVGLGDRTDFKPTQLSGGQCQRVAIARAIVNNPKILLADEPTGALDTKSGEQIMEIFHRLHEEGVTIIMITHEPDIAQHAQRILHIRDGRLTDASGNFLSPETEPAFPEAPEPLPVSRDTVVSAVELHKVPSPLDRQPLKEQYSKERGAVPEQVFTQAEPAPAQEALTDFAKETPDLSPVVPPEYAEEGREESLSPASLEEELEQALAADVEATILSEEFPEPLEEQEPILEEPVSEEPEEAEPEPPEALQPLSEEIPVFEEISAKEAPEEASVSALQEEAPLIPQEASASPQEEAPESFLDEELSALLEGTPAEPDPLFAQLGAVGSERPEPTGEEIVKEPPEEQGSFPASDLPLSYEGDQLSFLEPEEDVFDLSEVSSSIDAAENFVQLAFDVWGDETAQASAEEGEAGPEEELSAADPVLEEDAVSSEEDLPEGRFGTPISTDLSLTFDTSNSEELPSEPGDKEAQP